MRSGTGRSLGEPVDGAALHGRGHYVRNHVGAAVVRHRELTEDIDLGIGLEAWHERVISLAEEVVMFELECAFALAGTSYEISYEFEPTGGLWTVAVVDHQFAAPRSIELFEDETLESAYQSLLEGAGQPDQRWSAGFWA